jgi:macrolide-specific efflux system membrane fusion protein
MPANSGRVLLKALIIVALLGAAAAGVVSYLRPVAKVDVVRRGDIADIVSGTVVVEAERISSILSEVEGKVKESHLVAGQAVKEGDVLVELDPTDINLEIAQARSEYEAAEKTSQIARALARMDATTKQEDLDAAKRLHTDGKLAEADFTKAQRAFDIATQTRDKAEAEDVRRVAQLRNALDVAERKKTKMTITAPFDGTITAVKARKNDLVGAKEAVAQIIADAQLVKAKISEEYFSRVQVGQKARVTFLGYGGEIFAATVTQKLPAAEADTQRYIAYLKVDLPAHRRLLPNLTGEVGIILGENKGVLLVPRRATWDGGYLYVVKDGRARKRKAETGFADFNYVEARSGVTEGDVIIVEEKDRFEDGDRVRTQTLSPAH